MPEKDRSKLPSNRTNALLSKVSLYVGIALLALGVLTTAAVLFEVNLNQTDCEGGLSPVPTQGCGYVPQLVLFVWGEYPGLVDGLYLIYLGCAVLVVRWLVQIRPRVLKECAKLS